MKSLTQLVAVMIFAALACTGLHAQTVDLRAAIPFNFHAGDKLMPAGEYVIQEQGSVIWLRDADRHRPAFALMTVGAAGRNLSPQSRLEFNRYGSEYFLTEVWGSFTQDGRQLLPTARQKELAKRGDVPASAEVILASK